MSHYRFDLVVGGTLGTTRWSASHRIIAVAIDFIAVHVGERHARAHGIEGERDAVDVAELPGAVAQPREVAGRAPRNGCRRPGHLEALDLDLLELPVGSGHALLLAAGELEDHVARLGEDYVPIPLAAVGSDFPTNCSHLQRLLASATPFRYPPGRSFRQRTVHRSPEDTERRRACIPASMRRAGPPSR